MLFVRGECLPVPLWLNRDNSLLEQAIVLSSLHLRLDHEALQNSVEISQFQDRDRSDLSGIPKPASLPGTAEAVACSHASPRPHASDAVNLEKLQPETQQHAEGHD